MQKDGILDQSYHISVCSF